MKTAEICCSKTSFNFGRCYGNQGWAETVENQMLFLKISSFEKSGLIENMMLVNQPSESANKKEFRKKGD